ncbi:hypothetical protein ABPG72_010746 [Tetrahymena utriculariae]
MNFLNKKKNFVKDSKKAQKNQLKENSKNKKAENGAVSGHISEEEVDIKQTEKTQKVDLKNKNVEKHDDEQEASQNEKKLSKKEMKKLKKCQNQQQDQTALNNSNEQIQVESASDKSKSKTNQVQSNEKKDQVKQLSMEDNKKASKQSQNNKDQQQIKQETIQKVEPKIVKKPKITIIEENDDSECEVEKKDQGRKNKNKKESESQQDQFDNDDEDDSDLEEIKRVKKQMKGFEEEEDQDSESDIKLNKANKFDSDSEEENFKDVESSDDEGFKSKKSQTHKDTKKQQTKQKPYKAQDKKPKLKQLNEKIKLKHLAICIPDSIVSIPQSSELRSYFISELARTAAIFCVDEIIILKDNSYIAKSQNFQQGPYIVRNLQYLETPQYLRKQLFPIHPDLKNAGLMNPIECHHHLKSDQYCPYREGVVMNRPTKENEGSWVEIGLKKQAKIPYKLVTNTRVTLRINEPTLDIEQKYYSADVVSQKEPKEKMGLYWGYQVRLADNLSQVLKGEDDLKYDIKFLINQGDHQQFSEESISETELDLENKNVVIVFSGYNNLESIIDSDEYTKLSGKEALNKFDANFTIQKGRFGVKQLRLEEEMSHALSIIRKLYD